MSEAAKLETGNHSGAQLILQSAGAALPELFVINLCASMAPMPAVPKSLKGFEKYKLYQVSRQEDGRRRFRLRLGFFTSEADAEWVLNAVRSLYPTAFTGCLAQEDLRFAGDALPPIPAIPVHSMTQPGMAALAPTAKPALPAHSSLRDVQPAPRQSATPAHVNVTAKPNASITPKAADARPPLQLEIAPAIKPAASTAAPANGYAPAFHIARGIELPDIDLELTNEYEALPAPVKVSAPAISKAANSTPAVKPATNGPIHSAHVVNPPKTVDDYVPILDTTLTIRTLTKTEAEDPNRQKWFVVQLAVSEQSINLDTMPKLDIFAAYSLYSVAVMEAGKISQALRLGFFRENVSAEAVMGYLKAFFPTPSITQISTAEYERFAESKPKLKAEPPAKVVSLENKRPAPPNKPVAARPAQRAVPAPRKLVKPNVPNNELAARMSPAARPQSFLSRLIGRQLD